MAAPGDHKMGETVWLDDNDDSWQGPGLGHQHVVYWHYYLFGIEAERYCYLLYRIDGGAVYIDLTGLTKATIAHRDAEALGRHFNATGPQSIAEVCTTSGTSSRRRPRAKDAIIGLPHARRGPHSGPPTWDLGLPTW